MKSFILLGNIKFLFQCVVHMWCME